MNQLDGSYNDCTTLKLKLENRMLK
jgi:hypothetical protein